MEIIDLNQVLTIPRGFPTQVRIGVVRYIVLLNQLFSLCVQDRNGWIQRRTELPRENTNAMIHACPGCKPQVVGLSCLRKYPCYLGRPLDQQGIFIVDMCSRHGLDSVRLHFRLHVEIKPTAKWTRLRIQPQSIVPVVAAAESHRAIRRRRKSKHPDDIRPSTWSCELKIWIKPCMIQVFCQHESLGVKHLQIDIGGGLQPLRRVDGRDQHLSFFK